MFSTLRGGTPIYLLHKQEPRLEMAEVVSHSEPMPIYPNTYPTVGLMPQKMCVDVDVRINGQDVKLQKLPTDAVIADCNGMVVAETKDAIINEVMAMSKCSQSIIDSVDHHKEVVERCHAIIEELSPEAKREAERNKEIETLKGELGELKGLLSQLLNKKKKEE